MAEQLFHEVSTLSKHSRASEVCEGGVSVSGFVCTVADAVKYGNVVLKLLLTCLEKHLWTLLDFTNQPHIYSTWQQLMIWREGPVFYGGTLHWLMDD